MPPLSFAGRISHNTPTGAAGSAWGCTQAFWPAPPGTDCGTHRADRHGHRRSQDGEYCIRCLEIQDTSRQVDFHGTIRNVEVLGCGESPEWSRDQEGLHIRSGFVSDSPVVFKLELE